MHDSPFWLRCKASTRAKELEQARTSGVTRVREHFASRCSIVIAQAYSQLYYCCLVFFGKHRF